MRRAIVFLLLCPPFWAQSQPPVDPSTLARAEGRVVNAATGEPLRKAQLTLHNGPGTDYTAVSDASGHFVIERIIPGSYNLTGEHQNFSVMDYGATRTAMPGRKINFTAGQSVADLEIKLVPFGVISGKVVDQDGDPVAGVPVTVMHWGFARGGRQLMASGGGGSTNDRGEYRIYNLAAGRYYIVARPVHTENYSLQREFVRGNALTTAIARGADSGRESFTATFYPSSPDATAATAVVVGAGLEVPGVDVQLRKARTWVVQGRLAGVQKGKRYSLSMQPQDSASSGNFGGGRAAAVRAEDGGFLFRGVAPGRYTLIASTDNRAGGRLDLSVGDADVDGVVVTLMEPGAIKGRVLLEASGANATSLKGHRVSLMPADGIPMNIPNASSADDGTFLMDEVPADRYRVECSPVQGTYLKTIRWSGQVSNDGIVEMNSGGAATLDLVFAPTTAQIDGDVKTTDDQPAAGTTVLLIPASAHESDFRIMMTDQNGHFSAKGVAPGSYTALATDVQIYTMPDAVWLKSLEKVTTAVAVDENGHTTVALKAVPETAIEAAL